jgi:hypothetical protein
MPYDQRKDSPYIPNANRYRLLKPKYMELYSINPPSMAPIKFEERAVGIEVPWDISREKANPEKKIGPVSITIITILLSPKGRDERLFPENNMPVISNPASKP